MYSLCVQFTSKFPNVCCVFWPAFGCCAHPRAGWNTFVQPFSTFFVHSHLFQLFHGCNHWKTSENEPKNIFRQFQGTPQGVKQLLHVDQLWGVIKIWKKHVFCSFSDVFCWLQPWNHRKRFEWTKKVKNGWKKCFWQLLSARSTQKLVEIHNKCQPHLDGEKICNFWSEMHFFLFFFVFNKSWYLGQNTGTSK